jgi:hypothetical protein
MVRRPDEMNKPGKIILRGPFKGKRVELAPTDDLEMFRSFADQFMQEIFSMEPGSYLITDESSLRDFQGVEDLELPDIHRKIREVYDIDVSDIVSGNLVDVFARIHSQTYGQGNIESSGCIRSCRSVRGGRVLSDDSKRIRFI